MKMRDAMEMEHYVQQYLEKVKKNLFEEIKANSTKGYQNSPTNICTINLKDLDKTILSPSYYHPRQQANLVRSKLDNAKTPSEFMSYAKDMVRTKQITIGKTKEMLNPRTVRIISEYLERV